MRHLHSHRSMPLTAEQKKNTAGAMRIVLMILAGLVAALFIYRCITKYYLEKVRKKAAADYPNAELVQLDEGSELFPDKVRAVFWDMEYGFLFIQDYRRENGKPVAASEHPDSYNRRMSFRQECDACALRVSDFTDAPYLIRYDTDMQGITVVTQETERTALNRLLSGLQSLQPKFGIRFSIVSCPEKLYELFKNGNPETVLKDPLLALECGTIQQGEVMQLRTCSDQMIAAFEGDWNNSLEYFSKDRTDGIPEDYRAEDYAGECIYAVTELAGKTGQETAELRCWSITRSS
ncbi:MAG: hypothetical protein IKI58_02785 [Oscillospiraceae bacterium]|nr:hypothetical protein [Oscillospiraceae bacterium]